MNNNPIETNTIEPSIIDDSGFFDEHLDEIDNSNQRIVCSDSGLVVDNVQDCPSPCENGYFVMLGIECSDVSNPIQCEGSQIVDTDLKSSVIMNVITPSSKHSVYIFKNLVILVK